MVEIRPGTLVYKYGVLMYMRGRDGWLQRDGERWLYCSFHDDSSIDSTLRLSAWHAEYNPEFKTYPYQKMPDIDVPKQAEFSGEQMMHLGNLMESLQLMGLRFRINEDVGADRIDTYLTLAAEFIQKALDEDPKSLEESANTRLWKKTTGIDYRLDEASGKYVTFPYEGDQPTSVEDKTDYILEVDGCQ